MIFSAEQLATMGAAAARERERKRAELGTVRCHYCRSTVPAADARTIDLEPHAADGGKVAECRTCAGCPPKRSSGTPAPLPAQLDLDGGAHEIARPTERLRLFEPAPAQLEGQAFLTDAELEL